MSNREPDGRSKPVDYAKLGRAHVQALLDSGQSHWTDHQQLLARKWLEQLKDEEQAAAAQVSRESLEATRDGVGVGRQTLQVNKEGLSVMRITLWATLAGLVIAYLALKSSP